MMQLLLTAFFIMLFVFHKPTKEYFQQNGSPYVILAFVITIGTMLAMACCESVRRTTPMNYIFLFIFTLAEGFLMGIISAYYKTNDVSIIFL